jgi:hypothetical protein
LAILGSIVLILLAYLLQQGYTYNAKQSLEMYTFRQALRLSRTYEKGITLTVIRDIFNPSFFSSLNRQRIMATASVEYNPWKLYAPNVKEDIASRRLFQIGDAMIVNDTYYEIPPVRMKVATKGNSDPGWMWSGASIQDIDPQSFGGVDTQPAAKVRLSSSRNTALVRETAQAKIIKKDLTTIESIPTIIIFDDAEKIQENQLKDSSWIPNTENEYVESVQVKSADIPFNVQFQLEEQATRSKETTTLHGK